MICLTELKHLTSGIKHAKRCHKEILSENLNKSYLLLSKTRNRGNIENTNTDNKVTIKINDDNDYKKECDYTCLIWIKKLNGIKSGANHILTEHSELYKSNKNKLHLLL